MHATTEPAGELTSLYYLILDNPNSHHVNLTTHTFSLGKWNISTHKDKFAVVQLWIDCTVIPIMYKLVPDISNTQFPEFPHPYCLGQKASPKPGLYAQSFSNAQLATTTTTSQSKAPIHRTWGNTVTNFEFQFDESFPPLASSKTAKSEDSAKLSLLHLSPISSSPIMSSTKPSQRSSKTFALK
jgi:hypothetical protein